MSWGKWSSRPHRHSDNNKEVRIENKEIKENKQEDESYKGDGRFRLEIEQEKLLIGLDTPKQNV